MFSGLRGRFAIRLSLTGASKGAFAIAGPGHDRVRECRHLSRWRRPVRGRPPWRGGQPNSPTLIDGHVPPEIAPWIISFMRASCSAGQRGDCPAHTSHLIAGVTTGKNVRLITFPWQHHRLSATDGRPSGRIEI
jgi:hypothetical protein